MEEQKPKHKLVVNIDAVHTPILYADLIRVTPSENGFVLDIIQSFAGTNQANVVTRIGMSKEHAKKLASVLAQKVVDQGGYLTSKVKIS